MSRRNRSGFQLQPRDIRILETIDAFDGLLSLRQIDGLFFSGKGGSWPRERMRLLVANGYVRQPPPAELHRVPLGETIYYLTERGAEVVAALHGESLDTFTWRSRPRWSLIAHNLAVNEFRLTVLQASQSNGLQLHRWLPESEFWSRPDRLAYTAPNGTRKNRYIRPDGFFTLRRPAPAANGRQEELAFLLEIDRATEDNPRFARDKVVPGVAYLHSRQYQERFGVDYGRFLVVTTSPQRLENLKAHTERAGGERLFYFSTFDQVTAGTVLTAPIWCLAGETNPVSLAAAA